MPHSYLPPGFDRDRLAAWKRPDRKHGRMGRLPTTCQTRVIENLASEQFNCFAHGATRIRKIN